jgi:hypothetical protein
VLPIVEFKNKALDPYLYSANNTTQAYNYLMLSDDFNVKHLPGLINLGLQTKAEDTAFNITKIVGSFDPNKLKKIKDEEPNGLTGYMLDKVVLNAARYGEKGQTNSNSIIEGNPHLSEYSESIKRDFEMYFEGAGYSTPDQAVMDSATQVLYAKSRDVETTNQKRTLYTSKFIELIDKCLVVEGITNEIPINEDDREYSFSIKNNLQVTETDKLANIQQKLALGLASKLDSIMELYGISKEEAKVKLEEIDKEKEKELKTIIEQQKLTFDGMQGNPININNNMPGAPKPEADQKPNPEAKGVE